MANLLSTIITGGSGTTPTLVLDRNIATPSNYYNGLQFEVRATSGTAGIGLHRNGYSHVGIYHDSTNELKFNMNSGTPVLLSSTGTIWGSGNDGAGSGLDADLLDGQQGSYYQPASTAITTSNIGSQSVSYASNSGALGGLGVGSFLRDDGWNTYPGQDANTQGEMRVDFTYSNNAPYTGELIRFGSSGYSTQFNTSYGNSDNFAFRTRNGDNATWNAWRNVIHSGNISSQSVSYATSAGDSTNLGGRSSSRYLYYRGISSSGDFQSFQSTESIIRFDQVNDYNGLSNPPGGYTYGGVLSMRGDNFGFQLWGSHTGDFYFKTQWNNDQYSGWRTVLHSSNYGSYAVPITGTVLTEGNYFYFRSNIGSYLGGLSSPPLQAYSTGGNAAFMSFHRSGSYAVNFGLDQDNVMRIGGWSAAADRWVLDMSGNNTVAGSFRAPIFYDSNDTTYYLDPNSSGTSLKINGGIVSTAGNGAVLLKHENSEANAWIFRENSANWGLFWFNAGGQSGQTIGSYTTVGAELFGMNNAVTGFNPNSAWSGTDASTRAAWMLSNYSGYLWTQGTQYSETDMRAPIFYDSQDTGYYLDPNGSSNLNNVTANQSYANGWFRNNANNTGLYNQNTTMHLSSSDNGFWDISSTNTESSIRFYTGGHKTALRGYVYANSSNNIGFLDNSGNWSLRTDSSRNTYIYNELIVGYNQGSSSIQMYDSDEGSRYIHCNSNRIGFLTQAGYWGSWCDDDGNWTSVGNLAGAYLYSNYSVRVGEIWGQGGLYRSSGMMLFGTENEGWRFSMANSQKMYIGTDGNIWMAWAGDYISNLLAAKQNASTAITTSNIGSQSVNYANSAGAVAWSNVSSKPATWLNEPNLIQGSEPDTIRTSGFFESYLGSGNPTGTWMNYINVRHSNTNNGHGFQIGMSYYDNNLWFRSYSGNIPPSFQSWSRALGTNTDPYPSNMNQYVRTTDDVTHNSTTSPTFLVNNHSDNTKGYRIHNTSGTSVSAMFTNSSNQLVIAAGALDQINLNKKVYVNGVALGVNVAPSATAGRIDASNDIVAYSTSDERFKENITPISNALDKVKTLTGVEFDWRKETKDYHGYVGHDVGVIAQQVKAVLPEAVRTNANGYLAVRYEKLIGLLIEGMKEQQAQIDELKAKLDGITK